MSNRVKPTKKQLSAFEHLKTAKTMSEAMVAGGYSSKTSMNPKQKLVDSVGFKALLYEYREDLRKAGVSKEVLAQIQVAGLLDGDPKVRLDYLKETKKDLGIDIQKSEVTTLIQQNFGTHMESEIREFEV